MDDNLSIEIHQAKDMAMALREMETFLKVMTANESAKFYLQLRIDTIKEGFRKAILKEEKDGYIQS